MPYTLPSLVQRLPARYRRIRPDGYILFKPLFVIGVICLIATIIAFTAIQQGQNAIANTVSGQIRTQIQIELDAPGGNVDINSGSAAKAVPALVNSLTQLLAPGTPNSTVKTIVGKAASGSGFGGCLGTDSGDLGVVLTMSTDVDAAALVTALKRDLVRLTNWDLEDSISTTGNIAGICHTDA